MTHAESEEEGLKCLLCSRPGNTQLTYLGGVTAQVQAHQLCIKFAKGIKNKKSVIGNTRLQVSSQEEPTLSLIDESFQNEVAENWKTICVFCKRPGATAGNESLSVFDL